MKVEEIFHREMDIAFVEEKDRFVVVYMNYIIVVFYKSDAAHLKHLEKIFLNCRKIGILINPKNFNFSMKEGRLLGHII